jgi:type I restriction enzyme M protein
VIVPDGVLFGTSNAHINTRKVLVDKCKLEGVVSMPSGVFKPYAGVSTAVLVFQKGGTTDNVWFYDMEADGFSLDDKRQKVAENDIPDIVKRWREKNQSHPERSRGMSHANDSVEPKDTVRKAAEAPTPYGEHVSQPEADAPPAQTPLDVTGGRKGKCFLVPADEIRANKYDLSISRYKEIEHKEIEYEKPDVIMAKVLELEKEIAGDIQHIKAMIR